MGAPHNQFDDLLDEHDLARITKRSLASIRRDRLLKKNCPFVKIGTSVRYLRSDVEDWLRSLPRRGGRQEQR
jgi:predicted DNA-binding transcriptional regulator AlpA